MIFNGKEHENAFFNYLKKFDISPNDSERVALIYILTITEDCRDGILDCYDPEERRVKQDALKHEWVTGTDARAIRLAFNLFNGGVPTSKLENDDKSKNLYDQHGEFAYDEAELLASTPCSIFAYGGIAEYLIQGIKLRFEI